MKIKSNNENISNIKSICIINNNGKETYDERYPSTGKQ